MAGVENNDDGNMHIMHIIYVCLRLFMYRAWGISLFCCTFACN